MGVKLLAFTLTVLTMRALDLDLAYLEIESKFEGWEGLGSEVSTDTSFQYMDVLVSNGTVNNQGKSKTFPSFKLALNFQVG
jgi:hypothetical protein